MKISVKLTSVNGGQKRYVVTRGRGKLRERHFFKTRKEADAQAQDMRLQQSQSGQVWMALTSYERNEIIMLLGEAKKRGIDLRAALDDYKPVQVVKKRVQEAFDEFMVERKRENLSRRTINELKSNVGRFILTCSQRHLSEVTRQDVLAWLEKYQPANGGHPRTFNAYLTSLHTFFRWCVRLKYLSESPAVTVLKIDSRRMGDLDKEPALLSLEQCKKLLETTRATDPGLIPYVGVCLFAGLRPEREAAKLTWKDIGSEILVRGMNSKTRQRRHVEMHPALKNALALPLEAANGPAAGDLPPVNLRRRFEAVRAAAGLLEDWKQDCMRHTFASMSLAAFGVEKTVAALGHGDYDMLFRHYRALVSPADAEKFWKLTA